MVPRKGCISNLISRHIVAAIIFINLYRELEQKFGIDFEETQRDNHTSYRTLIINNDDE